VARCGADPRGMRTAMASKNHFLSSSEICLDGFVPSLCASDLRSSRRTSVRPAGEFVELRGQRRAPGAHQFKMPVMLFTPGGAPAPPSPPLMVPSRESLLRSRKPKRSPPRTACRVSDGSGRRARVCRSLPYYEFCTTAGPVSDASSRLGPVQSRRPPVTRRRPPSFYALVRRKHTNHTRSRGRASRKWRRRSPLSLSLAAALAASAGICAWRSPPPAAACSPRRGGWTRCAAWRRTAARASALT